jgi:hypothetical protein
MTARIIDDPSTVGWELDPDTGRWMWTGAGSGSDSAGAGMVIQPDEPTDPVTGLQWMDSTTGRIWIWDEDKWLEFPAGGSADAGGAGGGAWELVADIRSDGASAVEFDVPENEFEILRLTANYRGVSWFPYFQIRRGGVWNDADNNEYSQQSAQTQGSSMTLLSHTNKSRWLKLGQSKVADGAVYVFHFGGVSDCDYTSQDTRLVGLALGTGSNEGSATTTSPVNMAGGWAATRGAIDGIRVTPGTGTNPEMTGRFILEGVRL